MKSNIMHERISYLRNKYNYLINETLFINSISKHQKIGKHKSILETSCLVMVQNSLEKILFIMR